MYARTARYEVPLDRVDDDIKQAVEIEEKVKAISGNKGFWYFADRKTGHTMSLTIWESEAALEASAAPTRDLRQQLTNPTGAKVVSVDEFETIVQPVEAGHAAVR